MDGNFVRRNKKKKRNGKIIYNFRGVVVVVEDCFFQFQVDGVGELLVSKQQSIVWPKSTSIKIPPTILPEFFFLFS